MACKDGIYLNRNFFTHSSTLLLRLLILHCCFWSFSLFSVSKQLLQAKKMKGVCLQLKHAISRHERKAGWRACFCHLLKQIIINSLGRAVCYIFTCSGFLRVEILSTEFLKNFLILWLYLMLCYIAYHLITCLVKCSIYVLK